MRVVRDRLEALSLRLETLLPPRAMPSASKRLSREMARRKADV